jgi:DNA-binding transcriptional ArsR family regulator
MSDLFDRLQNELDIRAKEDGITALDLTELPTPLRKIMRKMLRALELNKQEIAQILSELPQEEQKEVKNLAEALDILTKQGWLIELGEGESVRYKANLRRKRGSELAADIFNKLDERLSERQSKEYPKFGQQEKEDE